MSQTFRRVTMALLAFSAGACADNRVEEGRDLFAEHCTPCHGIDGKGRGPVADPLGLAPTDLTRLAERAVPYVRALTAYLESIQVAE